MVVNSVLESREPSTSYDWELDWPAILYVPVVEPMRRPIGLLVVGCRRDHWYSDDDVAYAQSLGLTLAPLVAALRRRLSKLNEIEGEVAQLLSYGFSTSEVARATRLDEQRARLLVDSVTRKLELVKADQLAFSGGRHEKEGAGDVTWT
jgi:DNA-binding CsgD family transcriptional regulator